MNHWFRRALLLSLIAVLVSALNGVTPAPAQNDDWPTSTPEEQGIDSSRLAEMFAEVGQRGYNLHSLLIIRNGYLVTEFYAYPHDADTLHELRSATKSVTSTLVGIAIDQGYLTGVDQRVVDFFTQREIASLDAAKRAITLEHLLTMSSGFAWGRGMIEVPSFYEMTGSPDWLQFVLDRPLSDAPGERFVYNSGGPMCSPPFFRLSPGRPPRDSPPATCSTRWGSPAGSGGAARRRSPSAVRGCG
jgi:CubicO group peptidase (beta-lactamase class C family)